MRGEPELTFTPKLKHSRDGLYGSDSDEPTTPKKIRKNNGFSRFIDSPVFPTVFQHFHNGGFDKFHGSTSGDDEQNSHSISPGTPPIFNHHSSSRRKGIPHRAPFW